VNIGAIVTVAQGREAEDATGGEGIPSRPLVEGLVESPIACHEFLGQTLLQRTLQDLREFGVRQQSVLFEERGCESLGCSQPPTSGKFFFTWENAVAQQLNEGAEILFLIRLGAYVEIDFSDLLRFHRETSSVLTQVYGKRSAFDLGVVSSSQLRTEPGSYRRRLSALIPYHGRYTFRGYSNRLSEPQDFRRLVHDALIGRNSIRPMGTEVGPNLWLGEDASVDSTACLAAPAYVGANTSVKGSCTIAGATAIERDCEVDFGTTVTDSCVLAGTYLGMGLNVVHSIVGPNRLFHLDRNIGMEISDSRLIGRRLTTPLLSRLTKSGSTKSMSSKKSLAGVGANFLGTTRHL
jgi:hypothetical protein